MKFKHFEFWSLFVLSYLKSSKSYNKSVGTLQTRIFQGIHGENCIQIRLKIKVMNLDVSPFWLPLTPLLSQKP